MNDPIISAIDKAILDNDKLGKAYEAGASKSEIAEFINALGKSLDGIEEAAKERGYLQDD